MENQPVELNPAVDMGSSDIILSQCEKLPEVCKTPLFIELHGQLKEIREEQQKLEQLLKNSQNPRLLKYYYRMENERVEIEKRLVKLFIES